MKALRSTVIFLTTGILIASGVLLSMIVFNKKILASNAPKALRLLVQAVAPPADLYAPLGMTDLDVSQSGLTRRLEFSNKYAGQHEVGLLLARFSEDLYFKHRDLRSRPELKLKIVFSVGDTVAISRVVEHTYAPFIGKEGSGFSLFEYQAPEELPIAEKVTCEVRVMQGNQEMERQYGPIRLFIRKASDK